MPFIAVLLTIHQYNGVEIGKSDSKHGTCWWSFLLSHEGEPLPPFGITFKFRGC